MKAGFVPFVNIKYNTKNKEIQLTEQTKLASRHTDFCPVSTVDFENNMHSVPAVSE